MGGGTDGGVGVTQEEHVCRRSCSQALQVCWKAKQNEWEERQKDTKELKQETKKCEKSGSLKQNLFRKSRASGIKLAENTAERTGHTRGSLMSAISGQERRT